MSKIVYNSPSLLVTSFTLKNLLMQCSEESITLCARLVDGECLANEPHPLLRCISRKYRYQRARHNIPQLLPGTGP